MLHAQRRHQLTGHRWRYSGVQSLTTLAGWHRWHCACGLLTWSRTKAKPSRWEKGGTDW